MFKTIATTIVAASVSCGAAAADAIDPGLYEITTKTNLGTSETKKQCLTQSDITKGMQPAMAKDCKSVRSVFAGGKFDYATTCPDMTMTMTGSYTATSYQIDGKVRMTGDDPMTMESHIVAKKIAGVCKP